MEQQNLDIIIFLETFLCFWEWEYVCTTEEYLYNVTIKVELFLFFTNLVHQFSFEPATAGELPSEDYAPGVTLLPKEFSARLIPRL